MKVIIKQIDGVLFGEVDGTLRPLRDEQGFRNRLFAEFCDGKSDWPAKKKLDAFDQELLIGIELSKSMFRLHHETCKIFCGDESCKNGNCYKDKLYILPEVSKEREVSMNFENYKKQFTESFGKVTPQEFVKEMEGLGYEFVNVDSEETKESQEERTMHNSELISSFMDHCKEEFNIEIPDTVFESFFNA